MLVAIRYERIKVLLMIAELWNYFAVTDLDSPCLRAIKETKSLIEQHKTMSPQKLYRIMGKWSNKTNR